MDPRAFIATVQLNLLRRPLLQPATTMDLLDRSWPQVRAMIEDGSLPFAFDIAPRQGRDECPRFFSLCVAEQLGFKCPVGPSRNFSLPQVLDLILPGRDLRGRELQRLLSCSPDHVADLKTARCLRVAKKPTAKTGINSSWTYQRASLADFLEKRRIL